MGGLLGLPFFTDMAAAALRGTRSTKQIVVDAHRHAVTIFENHGIKGT